MLFLNGGFYLNEHRKNIAANDGAWLEYVQISKTVFDFPINIVQFDKSWECPIFMHAYKNL